MKIKTRIKRGRGKRMYHKGGKVHTFEWKEHEVLPHELELIKGCEILESEEIKKKAEKSKAVK